MHSDFVTVNCPSCQETLQIRNDHPGSSVRCKHCNKYHPTVRENGNIIALASGLKSVEYAHSERHENMQCLLEHIERMVPLEKWGFTQSAKLFVDKDRYPSIIYNSPKCRVRFLLDYSGSGRSYAAFVSYGRLHAPNDQIIMKWNNEGCHCWHKIDNFTLAFLERLPPNVAVNRRWQGWKNLTDGSEFLNSGTSEIQYPLKLHTVIWDIYGNGLFDLFDLNQNELWSKYSLFLKEVYEIRRSGRQYKHDFPEPYKIC